VSEANYRQSARLKKPNARALPETAAASVRLSEKKETEIMKLQLKALSIALGAATLMCGSAWGEGQAGVGTGAVAKAAVDLRIIIPKVVLLRVGAASTTVDLLTFTGAMATPTAAGAPGSNLDTNWDGISDPTFGFTPTPQTLNASVYTNVSGVTVSCASSGFNAGGPTDASVLVVSTVLANGGFAHMGTSLTGCSGTTAVSPNSVRRSSWAYSIDPVANPAAWLANTYNTTVTYTTSAL
jgi:hypothetical protein